MAELECRYSAFVSYSHVDRKWASWLHRSLENFRIPKSMQTARRISNRLDAIFIDRAELATSSDLGTAVRDALLKSNHLIVICSPSAAKSRWVNEEIRIYRNIRQSSSSIYCLIVDGIPNAGPSGHDPDLECFPPALREGCSFVEPLAADVRAGQDSRTAAKLKILAGLLGVGLDDLTRRHLRQRQRRLAMIAISATIGLALMTILAIAAFISRQRAVESQVRAERSQATAERTADFIKGLFRQSDPSEAKGNTVTAREVLDRGARRISSELLDQPLVRADFGATLGEVYASLGLYREGLRLLNDALSIPGQSAAGRAQHNISIAEILFSQGHYGKAEQRAKLALVGIGNGDASSPEEVRALLILGQVLTATGRTSLARTTLDRALRISSMRSARRSADAADIMEAIGVNSVEAGDLADASNLFREAAVIRLRTGGHNDPGFSEDLSQLGSIAYLEGELAVAERYFERALAIDRRVIGDDHPELAVTLQNVARTKLERRNFKGAAPLLEKAIAITLSERSSNTDDLAFFYVNLAIARDGMGDPEQAKRLVNRGIAIAERHQHRNLGPAMAVLADLQCRTGEISWGLATIAKAEPIMRRAYPDHPWRLADLRSVKGGCLKKAGYEKDAAALFERSTPIIIARWGPDTLYGHAALSRQSRQDGLTTGKTK